MKGPSQPAPPDPAVQTSNEAAANRYDINSPFGTQHWDQGQQEQIGTDSSGKPIMGQHYTQNITLDPSEQRQFDTRNQISETLMNQGKEGIEKGLPGYTAAPTAVQVPDAIKDPQSMGKFDINAASSPAADAQFKRTMDYLAPYQKRQQDANEQRLANEGLPLGSEAYKQAHDILSDEQNRQITDAASGAAAMAPQIALSGRQQQASETGQDFGRELSGYGAQLSGQAQQQQLQGSQEQQDIAKRQQYYNEIAASLGGQQLNPINAGGGGGDSALNVANAFQQYNSGVMNNYNQNVAQRNAQIGAAADITSSLIPWSDERLKDDIEQVGELPTGEGIYDFHYKWEDDDEPLHTGVMAQEIEERYPEAVVHDPSGYRKVDYRRLISQALSEAA